MKSIVYKSIRFNFFFGLAFVLTFLIVVINEISFFTDFKYRKWHDQGNAFLPKTKYYIEERENVFDGNYPKDATWQPVTGSRFKFFVYSAYLDTRSKKQWLVRIIAATKTKNPDQVACVFYYETKKENINAKITPINEHWSLPYSATFIICNLKNVSNIPIAVSIVAYDRAISSYKPSSNMLIVNNRNITDATGVENYDKIAVCVKPMHFSYDKTIELIEFIELNKLLGTSHFTFYNASIGSHAKCALEQYSKEGTVSVLPWKLGIKSKVEIRTEGIFAALNDCLYRNMFNYPYIAFTDMDEFIVPRYNSTLMELIRWLSLRYNTRTISSFSFQNAFFYLQWGDDPNIKETNEIERNLITLRKTRRRVKLNAHKQRSKYIVKSVNVVEVGNHFVWKFFPNQNTLNVPSNIAILNHYRVCEYGGDDCVRLSSMVDRTLYRYRKPLTCNVARKLLLLSEKCDLPKINFDKDNVCKK